MNWAIVFLAGILVISTGYFFAVGHKHYKGPLVEADVHEDIRSPERSSNEVVGEKI